MEPDTARAKRTCRVIQPPRIRCRARTLHRLAAVLVTAVVAPAQDPVATEDHGTATAAVERGVTALVAAQREDGAWSDGPRSRHDEATTGLAILALLADGNTIARGPHAVSLSRALDWLAARLDEDGALRGPTMRRAFDQAVVTFALGEGANLSRDDVLRARAALAGRRLLAMRDVGGGWTTDFAPGEVDTTLVSAWARLALQSAVPAEVRDADDTRRLSAWLGVDEPPAGWPANARPRAPDAARLLVGSLDHELAGPPVVGSEFIRAEAILDRIGAENDDPIARYVAVLAAFLEGRDLWLGVAPRLLELVELQRADGTWAASKRWSEDGGGTVSATALAALVLRVHTRYTRLRR